MVSNKNKNKNKENVWYLVMFSELLLLYLTACQHSGAAHNSVHHEFHPEKGQQEYRVPFG